MSGVFFVLNVVFPIAMVVGIAVIIFPVIQDARRAHARMKLTARVEKKLLQGIYDDEVVNFSASALDVTPARFRELMKIDETGKRIDPKGPESC